jgi:anti-sigma B factor antagonist
VSTAALPTLRLSGEIDLHTTRALGESFADLAASPEPTVAVDISAVTFMDSTALGALVLTHRRRRRQGRSLLVICPPSSPAHRILELSVMLDVLQIVSSATEASQG